MTPESIVVHGTIKPDGTLEVTEKVSLPPGPVEVTVKSASQKSEESSWAILQRIWADQKASGYVPRTREEIDADLNALRDEAEDELRARESGRG